jgi:hypothetical protein
MRDVNYPEIPQRVCLLGLLKSSKGGNGNPVPASSLKLRVRESFECTTYRNLAAAVHNLSKYFTYELRAQKEFKNA